MKFQKFAKHVSQQQQPSFQHPQTNLRKNTNQGGRFPSTVLTPLILFDTEFVNDENRKEYRIAVRAAGNYFKHGTRDPEALNFRATHHGVYLFYVLGDELLDSTATNVERLFGVDRINTPVAYTTGMITRNAFRLVPSTNSIPKKRVL